jgi:hypothetical protein
MIMLRGLGRAGHVAFMKAKKECIQDFGGKVTRDY